jgi:hypothetical protein
MSGITLSAAVSALQPGLPTAPEVAKASWTVINNLPEMVSPFMKTNFHLAAVTTGLLGLSIVCGLIRARIPSTQKSPASVTPRQWHLLYAASSASLTSVAFSRSLMTLMNVSTGCYILSKKIPPAITNLIPGMTAPSEKTLEGWAILKHFVSTTPVFTGCMQRSFMWTGIIASAALVATAIAINYQKEDHPETTKHFLDGLALTSLGLASIASLCGYLYVRTYAPIFS